MSCVLWCKSQENKRMDVKFATTVEELTLIGRIFDRADRLGLVDSGRGRSGRIMPMMDLAACHANGCPMDFGRMLSADDLDFSHDFLGISRHLDRSTGRLRGRFTPRSARQDHLA